MLAVQGVGFERFRVLQYRWSEKKTEVGGQMAECGSGQVELRKLNEFMVEFRSQNAKNQNDL